MSRIGTEKKIRGIEQEYPVSARASFNPSVLVNAAIHGLKRKRFSREVPWDLVTEVSQERHESRITSSSGDNGSRIYNDLGHLEIATPSYNNPFDAVAYDRASEIYAFFGSREASLALKEKVVVHKNNIANFFTSSLEGGMRPGKGRGKGGKIKTITYATHGNIITQRAACEDWSRVEKALIPWVVTRILFTGSGDVVSGEAVGKEGVKFVISPRAIFTVQESSLSTTTMRGILNTRDQPHAARQYWRLHDIHYEALRSEYALFLRDIAQALVIRAFESGFLDAAPEIEDPVSAFKKLSLDTQDCNWRVKLKTGEKSDAVAILRFYLDAIERMQEEEGSETSKWDDIGLKSLWHLMDDLEARRVERYVDGIDWVTKLALLVNYEPKTAAEGMSICNQYALLDESVLQYLGSGKKAAEADCLYNPRDSFAFVQGMLAQVDWASLPERVEYAMGNAPEQTRDFFRVALLKRFGSQVRTVSWSTIVLAEAKIVLDEPFMLNKAELGSEMLDTAGLKGILTAVEGLYPGKVFR